MASSIITHREQTYVERYIDGELSKMMKYLTQINEKYKDIETEDIHINYVKSFFNDDAKLMMEYKRRIKKDIKNR